MSLFMLDTDTCSYIIKEKPLSAFINLEKHAEELVCISVVTYAELIYGVERISSKKVNRSMVESFIQRLFVYQWDQAAAEHYASIRNHLEKQGNLIGNMDMMIAAHARSLRAILITNNSKHFKKVPHLQIDNWI